MTNTNTAEQTFLYSVHPRTIIKELPVAPIRVPKSLYLTKDQVLICLKHGAVYRRFANEGRNEKVTITSVDRLHNEKFMTEEQYAAFLQSGVADNRGTILGDVTGEGEKSETETTPDQTEESEGEENASEETIQETVDESETGTPDQTEESEGEEHVESEEEDECAACSIDYSSLETPVSEGEETVDESTEQEGEEEATPVSEEPAQQVNNNNQNWNNGKNKHGNRHR